MAQTLLSDEAVTLLHARKDALSDGRKKARNGSGSTWAIIAAEIGITESYLHRLITPSEKQRRGVGTPTLLKLSRYLKQPESKLVNPQ